MTNRRGWMTVMLALGMALAVGATFAQDDDEIELTIEMGEFYFQVEGQERNAPIVLEAGQAYEITFVNVGMMEHEVLIGRDLILENGSADGYQTNLLDQVVMDVVEDEGFVRVSGMIEFELEEGASITLELTLPDELIGTWEIGCFIPGHYEAGMKAPVEVR